MPHAMKNGGLVFGGIGTILIGIICAHCVHILVRSSHVLCKRTKTPQMTYAETAEAAFLCGPKPLRPFANASRIFVNIALCATYVGGTCVYLVFIATSLRQVSLTLHFLPFLFLLPIFPPFVADTSPLGVEEFLNIAHPSIYNSKHFFSNIPLSCNSKFHLKISVILSELRILIKTVDIVKFSSAQKIVCYKTKDLVTPG